MRAAFYKGTRPGFFGLYNRVVRLVDGGPYSHAELIFSDGMAASSSLVDGGVRFKRIAFDPARWDIVDLDPAQFDEAAARAWFVKHQGRPYDLAGNLKFVWSWWPASKTAWFCTSSIAAALKLPPAEKPWWYGPLKLAAAFGLPNPENYGPNGLAETLRDGGSGEER